MVLTVIAIQRSVNLLRPVFSQQVLARIRREIDIAEIQFEFTVIKCGTSFANWEEQFDGDFLQKGAQQAAQP
jgi:hypothetical protein